MEQLSTWEDLLRSLRTPIVPFPIQFSLPESKIVPHIPAKSQDFARLIPGQRHTYIYTTESAYYQDYQRSHFAITCKKGGWDCLRHYEILANGCIPYFLDLDKCPATTLTLLPKELIQEAMHLPGVSQQTIDHTLFDKARYDEILTALLAHTRQHLTNTSMAKYMLSKNNYIGEGNILFLSNDPSTDYLRCLTLIGLKELYGQKIVDFPKIEHIYKNYSGDTHQLYGKGFSYTRVIDDHPVDRNDIAMRIKNREFDVIIQGSVHRGLPFHDLILQTYDPQDVIYLCGEDDHSCPYRSFPNLFLREYN